MELNPIETWPKKDEFISTVADEVARWSAEKRKWAQEDRERLRRRRRFGLYAAGMLMTAGLATVSVPSFLANYADSAGFRTIAREKMPVREILPERKQIIEQEPHKAVVRSRDVAAASAESETRRVSTVAEPMARPETEQPLPPAEFVAAEQKQAFEHERQRGDALARDLALAGEEVAILTARLAATRTEAEQASQAAQASAAELKQALEQERQRADSIAHELALARQEIEVLMLRVVATSAGHAEIAQAFQAAQASAAEQKRALEQERKRADGLARDLTSAREEVETLTARFTAAIAAHIEAVQTLQAAQPSDSEQKQELEQQRQRSASVVRFEEFDTSDAGSATNPARPVAPMIFARPTDPGTDARPGAPGDMGAQAPRERTAARSDLGETWPHASIHPTPGASIHCLPAPLRTVLTELEKRFGPVTIVSTTHLHTDNHSPGSIRANLHSACKAVDIKTSREPNEVIAYLRSRPEVGGVNTYRNRVVHIDLNANYNRRPPTRALDSKRVRRESVPKPGGPLRLERQLLPTDSQPEH